MTDRRTFVTLAAGTLLLEPLGAALATTSGKQGSDTTFERSARDGNRGFSKIVSDVLFSP